jgi:hypothetical protein
MPKRKSTKRGEPPTKVQGWTAIAKYVGVSKATAQQGKDRSASET